MRTILTYTLALCLGFIVALVLAAIVALISPIAAVPVFAGICIWWAWTGWRYACARDNLRKTAPKAPSTNPIPEPATRPTRQPKVAVCIRAIESELLKRTLSNDEERQVADLCSSLLQKALGEEGVVIRLVKLEWAQSLDPIDAFRRAQERWERDHSRFG